jgi:hypothetical protein
MKKTVFLALLSVWLALPVFGQDVPAIKGKPRAITPSHSEPAFMKGFFDQCRSMGLTVDEAKNSCMVNDGWKCADKKNILLTAEDGTKWCHKPQALPATAPQVIYVPYYIYAPSYPTYSWPYSSGSGLVMNATIGATSKIKLNGTAWNIGDLQPLKAKDSMVIHP